MGIGVGVGIVPNPNPEPNLRKVERHCTRPTTILKTAEIWRGVLGGSRDSSRASGVQQPPSTTCAPVEDVVAVRR